MCEILFSLFILLCLCIEFVDCGHHKHHSVAQENVCALNKEGICNHQLHKIRSRDEFGAMTAERNFTIGAELGVQTGWYSDMFLDIFIRSNNNEKVYPCRYMGAAQ
jgi:hypothetical protein